MTLYSQLLNICALYEFLLSDYNYTTLDFEYSDKYNVCYEEPWLQFNNFFESVLS